MGFDFTLTADSVPNVTVVDELDVQGEDIALSGGQMIVSPNGDLGVVRGVDAGVQSVVRELPANPGSFPRRQEWGGGLQGLLFKGATSATRDKMQSRARTRLIVNPRVTQVRDVSAFLDTDSIDGLTLRVRCETISGFIDEQFVIKPPGA